MYDVVGTYSIVPMILTTIWIWKIGPTLNTSWLKQTERVGCAHLFPSSLAGQMWVVTAVSHNCMPLMLTILCSGSEFQSFMSFYGVWKIRLEIEITSAGWFDIVLRIRRLDERREEAGCRNVSAGMAT